MSFQLPDSQRSHEETYWRQKTGNGHAKGGGGIASKINTIFSDEKHLPMYKDKPDFPGSRRRSIYQRKRPLAVLGIICTIFLWWMGLLSFSSPKALRGQEHFTKTYGIPTSEEWESRREAVKEAFITSWDGYEKYAWGMDEYHPISRTGKNMVEGGMGWIIVDALDTAIMMNLTSRVARAREWISTSLSYTANHDVSTFETTIRMLGGLLSAHYLSTTYPNLAPLKDDDVNQPGEDLYIEKATDLADRLLGAYDTTSGIPVASVNLNTSMGIPAMGDGGASSTSEAATLQLEMKYLSLLTGEPNYWQRSEYILKVIDDQQQEDGLLPIYIHPETGTFRGSNIRLGSRGDSYYEYLIKQYLQTSETEPVYLEMWEEALEGVKKHLITYSEHAGLTILGERPSGLHAPLSPKMDHLVCFMPGTIALAVTGGATLENAKERLGSKGWTKKHEENMILADELMKTCWGMYKLNPTGLAPEIAFFHTDNPPKQWYGHTSATWTQPTTPSDLSDAPGASWRADYDIHPNDVHNLQRPETIESLFYMYRITRDSKYREWGWEIFESFREHTKVIDEVTGKVYGYTSLDTVMNNPVDERLRRDNMESFWLAETLKYLYLLFSDEDFFPLEDVVINTEAHFFPRLNVKGSPIWKTNWQRAPRDTVHKHPDDRVRGSLAGVVVGGGARRKEDGSIVVGQDEHKHDSHGQAKENSHLKGRHQEEFEDGIEHGHIEERGYGKAGEDGGHSELETAHEHALGSSDQAANQNAHAAVDEEEGAQKKVVVGQSETDKKGIIIHPKPNRRRRPGDDDDDENDDDDDDDDEEYKGPLPQD